MSEIDLKTAVKKPQAPSISDAPRRVLSGADTKIDVEGWDNFHNLVTQVNIGLDPQNPLTIKISLLHPYELHKIEETQKRLSGSRISLTCGGVLKMDGIILLKGDHKISHNGGGTYILILEGFFTKSM